jgi:hypothetical protein
VSGEQPETCVNKRKRQLTLAFEIVLFSRNFLAFILLALPTTASAEAERFVIVSNHGQIGSLSVSRSGNRLDIEFHVDDNGRGPSIRELMRLDHDGIPVERRIEGTSSIGAPVRENYKFRAGRATWKTLDDSGHANADSAPMYVANNGSPWDYGLYLRSTLKQPSQTQNALPAGTLRVEHLHDFTVGSGVYTQPVSVYALWGVDLSPKLVLARPDGELFGIIDATSVLVPERYESEFRSLSRLASLLNRQYLEQLTGRLLHRFDRPVYIRNVRVFDSVHATIGEPTTVRVLRDRITGVGVDVEPTIDSVIIDGDGGTLLPGLTDMHSHVSSWDLPLHLAAGVTTVRDLGGDNETLLDLAEQTRANTILGPRMMLSGFIEGRSPFSASNGFVVDQLPIALDKVRWYADHGYWGIKIYSSIRPEWVSPMVAEAHRLGLRVSGHVPSFMTSERVVREGFDEINHMNQLLLSFVLAETEDTRTPLRLTAVGERVGELDLQSEPVRRMVALMQERGTTLDVTMAGLEWLLLSQPGKSPPSIESWLSHMPGAVQRSRRTAVLDIKRGQLRLYRASWEKMLVALKLLHDAGVRIVPGTDDVPGFMLHSELEVYARAGIPNDRVLQIATFEVAHYLGRHQESGSIAPGNLADFLLVAGDPTRDMSVIRQVRMVAKNGDIIFPEEVYSAMSIRPFGRKPSVRLPGS